ncbi:hypothetical protein IV203_015659 [Nitzschia inconspicua]|uniref:Uncharacterized protein n=1 Tax=Nitzschia inconspicua TaxID=303405 RepID=A0A9K3LCA3_9STRA|nr:hypothetical protein IV203_015659 [Nitzschia inconspicua]
MKRRIPNHNGTNTPLGSVVHSKSVGEQKSRPLASRWNRLVVCLACSMFVASFALLLLQRDIENVHSRQHQIFPLKDLEATRKGGFERDQTNAASSSKSSTDTSRTHSSSVNPSATAAVASCAICFFGLPRSFQLLVLPSILRNVLKPNQKSTNRCDIYLHYYKIESEGKSRSSAGGTIDTEHVWLLTHAVKELKRNRPDDNKDDEIYLSIVSDSEESFRKARGEQLEKYMTTKGPDGKPLYYPWMAKSYDKRSIENMIKQWHSISQVFHAMEQGATTLNKNYTRVAMMRNDVVYVTPFDIYQVSNTSRDDANRQVVVPNFARFPINDRMVYGPYAAVKIWATERFDRLESHVRTYDEAGYGLHSERFLNHSIFPAIRELGYTVTTNPELCFFRARADGTAWINDCATRDGAAIGFRNLDRAQRLVEELVGHSCVRSKYKQRIVQVDCNGNSTTKIAYS